MAGSAVSVLMPARGDAARIPAVRERIERYLATTGFTFEIIIPDEREYGPAFRRGVADARGSVIVVIDHELPYPVEAIGDAVAMIESGASEVVFAESAPRTAPNWLVRWMLVPVLPDPSVRLQAFSSASAKLIAAESRLNGDELDLEIGFLSNKYGFRVERLRVDVVTSPGRVLHPFREIRGALRIRVTNRNMGYRAARRCPVCFSSEVWTCAQIPKHVIRACARCKCRYRNHFTDEDDTHPVRRVVDPQRVAAEPVPPSDPAREKTSRRRIAVLRKELPARARILEIGVRNGSFGAAAAREYD